MRSLALLLAQAWLVAESARRLERLLARADAPLASRWLAVQVLALAQIVAVTLALGYAGRLRTTTILLAHLAALLALLLLTRRRPADGGLASWWRRRRRPRAAGRRASAGRRSGSPAWSSSVP